MSIADHTTRPALRRTSIRATEPGRFASLRQISHHRSIDDALARLRLFSTLRPRPPVFSHWSAALIHGLPLLGPPLREIHILTRSSTENPEGGVVGHPRGDSDAIAEVRGLNVTSLARTVADIAGSASLMDAVVMADSALARSGGTEREVRTSRAELVEAAERLPHVAAAGRARAVAEFADPRAESPLESVSRVSMGLIGAPPPELQVTVGDLLGFRARLDFVWPELGLVGEADGLVKYLHPALRDGRTAVEVLGAQSERERLILLMGLRIARWGWSTGSRPDRMRVALEAAGVPLASGCTIPGIDDVAPP